METLRDAEVAAGVRRLIEQVRGHARIDAHVEHHLVGTADNTLLAA